MTLAVATFNFVGDDYAVALNPYSVTYLRRGLLLARDGLNGTRRTHLRTFGTFGTAVAILVREVRLHKVRQVGRGTQNM